VFGLLAYRIKPGLAPRAGYRYLYVDRRRASGTYPDVATSGVLTFIFLRRAVDPPRHA
jgi:hypothetical protein